MLQEARGSLCAEVGQGGHRLRAGLRARGESEKAKKASLVGWEAVVRGLQDRAEDEGAAVLVGAEGAVVQCDCRVPGLLDLGHQGGDPAGTASAQHRGGDLEGEGQVAAEGGQFAEGVRFAGRAVVAVVGVVEGAGDEGGGVVGREGFQVDEADAGEGVRAVAGGDQYSVAVRAR